MAAGNRATVTTAGVSSATFEWEGGPGQFVASGAFGGATMKLQFTPDAGVTWIDVALPNGGASLSLALAGTQPFDMPRTQMRFTLSVVGAGAAIVGEAVRRPQRIG